jgi:succinate dehydrogenase cytochrome b subunit
MRVLRRLWRSSVGKKALAAVSGLLVWTWLVLHLLGNLTAFRGPAANDGYAAALQRAAPLLWVVRLGLLAAAALHIAATLTLPRGAAAPRRWPGSAHGWASRGMRIGGVLLLAFVVFHVAHLTLGIGHPGFRPEHPYHNVVAGLHAPLVAAVYLAAAALLGAHLFHGLWSAPRSLGRETTRGRPPLRVATVAVAIALGFASVPLAVLAGVLR